MKGSELQGTVWKREDKVMDMALELSRCCMCQCFKAHMGAKLFTIIVVHGP